jgi:hypothetical protein
MLDGPPVADVLYHATLIGDFMAGTIVLATCIIAGLVGAAGRFIDGHNQMPGGIRAACYLSGLLLLGVAAVPFWCVTGFRGSVMTFGPVVTTAIGPPAVVLLVLSPLIVTLLVFFWLVARVAAGARFANR